MLLLEAAADGAGDEDVTPAAIAVEIEAALESIEGEPRRLLEQALDAVADGLPGDDVATLLERARATLDPDSGS